MKIELLKSSDAVLYLAHLKRHLGESGPAHGIIFHPVTEEGAQRIFERRDELAQSWARPIHEREWERAWGACIDEKIVGHINLRGGRQDARLHRATLGIGIEAPYRAQGLGRKLIQTALDWAKNQSQLAWIDLGVFSENISAQELYKSFGFVENGRVEDLFRIHNTKITDISMALRL